MRIGFIGNFKGASYTTENDRKWSFEQLGHTVIPFQENEISVFNLIHTEMDMLIYSHTHDPSYSIPGLIEVFKEFKNRGIPTVSVHLDRWAWLRRVADVGHEATWFTEYIFMADASPEAVELYDGLGLNWHYLQPGVIERDCYMAEPDHERFPHEIVFTGSKHYHPEYPFRPILIDFLKRKYGDNFGHYGNDGIRVLREGELNTMLATAKVVVGDSCFGGRPNYVSDRYYETRGRGGFLLHPQTEGVDAAGVGHYDRGDLDSVYAQIEHYLHATEEREFMRQEGFAWVKQHETYTNRAQEIIKVVFG